MRWKILRKIMFQIQMDHLKRLYLNQKFGLYQMDLGLFVHCIVALGIYLWPELVLVEEEVGYKEVVVVLGLKKVVEKVVWFYGRKHMCKGMEGWVDGRQGWRGGFILSSGILSLPVENSLKRWVMEMVVVEDYEGQSGLQFVDPGESQRKWPLSLARRDLFCTLNLHLDFQGSGEISVLNKKVEIGIEMCLEQDLGKERVEERETGVRIEEIEALWEEVDAISIIRTLISTKRPHPKEYIQSSRLDQCSLQATTAEQYVTLEIPPELISNCQREGFIHLHIEGVRLILTLYGRKGLPVTARIAMLDTRFTHYQDAVIGDPSESKTESFLESSISSSDSAKSYADITRILMAQLEETEPAQSSRTDPFFEIPSDIEEDPPEASSAPNRPGQPQNDHKPSNGPWFTFDDIPTAKWRDRLSEMVAWTDLQMLRVNATTASILRELATRFTRSLRDWFDTLGGYRQLQFVQLANVSTALSVIYEQFIGESAAIFEATRRDYLNMKCCSLNSKDLDFH
ncbi:hypothetical protein KPL70_023425 [Citrus sinensis]|nr:hypothetical protein KPL70_023425 [Citrus sinensis]